MQISGSVVLITGASEGLGAACVAAFRKRGARLAIVARNERKLREVGGADACIIAGDLTDPELRRRAVSEILAQYGAVDILINNAGVGLYAPAAEPPLDAARALFELNFFVPLAMTQLVAPSMRARKRGMIVNISSIAGEVTLPWLPLYSASKHALQSLTEGLRMELKRDGIHAMTVCPGYVSTAFQQHALGGAPPAALSRRRPLSITPERCAEIIARGVERNARTVMAPASGWAMAWLRRLLPGVVETRLTSMLEPRP